MRLESLVNQNYDNLNENDKIIIKQILICQREYRNFSCEKIANECNVSRATLLRLCRKIGLMNELQKISFQDICKIIYDAETIYIYGTGNEQKSLAQEIKRIFLSVGKCVIDLFDIGEIEFMRESFQKNDLFIIISLSGETKAGIEIAKFINNHIHTISLTRLDNNTIATLCEYNLYVETQKLDTLQAISYEVVGAFYALLDLLHMNYIEYRRRKE